MAKVVLNPVIKSIHGKLGDMVFRRSQTGKPTLIKLADMSNVKWSKAQKAHRQRFKEAVAYARSAMSNSQVRAVYEKLAKKQGKRPFDLAVSDYFKGIDRTSDN
ncbi:MAG TPA: hypothetical protein DEP19_09655 [Anaerolineae bacterium]|nr:hypothetical protein [Anaerolineae bacterium]HCK65816.1 hypothetical protein [Anaerolineae bacterium]